MVMGFLSGVALGQQLVGMTKGKGRGNGGGFGRGFSNSNFNNKAQSQSQRLQSAKWAAYQRMKSRQTFNNSALNVSNTARPQFTSQNFTPENSPFNPQFNYDPSGELLNSIRNSIKEFNDWIKRQTNGLLDLNMAMAIFFIARGIRKFILEKQYPSAWQLIWWASSILRGWRFM